MDPGVQGTGIGRRLVEAALRALPERERAALVLRDLEGRTTSEVARILGSSEGTVRSQISTARLKIRAFLAAAAPGRTTAAGGGSGPPHDPGVEP